MAEKKTARAVKKTAPAAVVKKTAKTAKTVTRKTSVGKTESAKKYVYLFGKGISEGRADMKELLGGKGANLAEMANLELPVPAGFTITTECCVDYFRENRIPATLEAEVLAALKKVEKVMGMKFGSATNPLLVSCRSGARSSMPGMMKPSSTSGFPPRPFPDSSRRRKTNGSSMTPTAVSS